MSEQLAQEVFRAASGSIDVLAPPLDDVVTEARALQRRRRRSVTAAVVAGAVVVAGLTWAATRAADQTPPPEPHVVALRNPIDLAWYSGGKLRLARGAVDVPPLTDLAEVFGGAVYGDRSGTVAFVAADGTRTVLGEKAPGAPLVASEEYGWAAWVDPGEDAPALVVYDVARGGLVDRQRLPAPGRGQGRALSSHPITIDQGRVYYATADGDFVWTPTGGAPERLDRDGLADVRHALQVYQEPGRIEIVETLSGVSVVRRGEGAEISPGGNFVLTRAPGDWSPGDPYRVLLYDARDGDRLSTGLGDDERVVDAAFVPTGGLVYLAARAGRLRRGQDIEAAGPGGVPTDEDIPPLVTLRTCGPGGADCRDVEVLPTFEGRPLLAH
jgi:hypothetical protein